MKSPGSMRRKVGDEGGVDDGKLELHFIPESRQRTAGSRQQVGRARRARQPIRREARSVNTPYPPSARRHPQRGAFGEHALPLKDRKVRVSLGRRIVGG